ncbi:MAG: acyl-CoA dehydrogenase [Peptococcaceae bacterium BICA1-7]|nr:MAG: acyl-CoA dehydrogenase [Peptococcaceae bacterium BICA1-7]HBV97272.1 acyl-CoA dehydrogenase [Desulfotomaculum sp.]
MNFELTDEQKLIRDNVYDFAQNEIAPGATERDKTGEIPLDIISKMGEMGLMGLPIAEQYGGAGADSISYLLATEEISRACASLGLTYDAHIALGMAPIYYFGTEEQKNRYLPELCSGQYLGSMGLTEPEAGTDSGNTKTTAVPDGDGWVINGSKCFITNSRYSRVVTVTAITDKGKGTRGISTFLVPVSAPGFDIISGYEKLGMNSSNTNELIFDNVRVPGENLLGPLNNGFRQLMKVLDGGRLAVAAICVGIAQACLDASVKYARERVQFGQSISKFQAIQFKLADMKMNIEVGRNMYLKGGWLKDSARPYTQEAAIAKLFCSEMATRAALEAIQIHGGYGYIKEFPVERYLRDAKLLEIGEGTSEVQRILIARGLGL